MTAAFLDTESTGMIEPRPIQLAYAISEYPTVSPGPLHDEFFHPQKPIEYGAMATHHIIPSDLEKARPWTECRLPDGVEYIIGHGVDYDWEVLGKPNVKRICTLAIARKVLPEETSHKLTALHYRFAGNFEKARQIAKEAHSARMDVLMLMGVWFDLMTHASVWPDTWEGAWNWSEACRIPERMTFGKYGPDLSAGRAQGELISWVKSNDRNYVSWLLSGKCDIVNNDAYLRKALEG